MNDFKYEPLSLERIQAEQDKHYGPEYTIDVSSVHACSECDLKAMDNFFDKLIEEITKETDLYIICEMAKAYLHEHREAEWIENTRYKRKGKRFYDCSNCHYGEHGDVMCEVQTWPKYCPNCGARMKLR